MLERFARIPQQGRINHPFHALRFGHHALETFRKSMFL
jgi:hypothetical protein